MKIKEKQNTQELLEKQYVARHCYNVSEGCGILSWLSCVVLTVIAVNFDSNKEIVAYTVAIVTILECVFDSIRQLYIKLGAAYRMYIDDVLFGLEEKEYYIEYSLKNLNAFAEQVMKIHKKACHKQITHSGEEKPNGVRDWYVLDDDLQEREEIYCCQSINIKFDKTTTITSIVLVVLLFVFVLLVAFNVEGKLLALCVNLPLLLKMGKSLYSYFQYFICKNKINVLKGQVKASGYSDEYIKKLQENINYRRQLNVVSFSAIYGLCRKFLHSYIKK